MVIFFFLFLFSLSLHQSQINSMAAAAELHSFTTDLQMIQQKIGYNFSAVELLKQALTHASFSGENNRAFSSLGLYAVEAAAALHEIRRDPDVSSAALAGAVEASAGTDACAAAGARLRLPEIVRVAGNTNSSATSVVCGAFRAIFGAVALDSRRIDAAADTFWKVAGEASAGGEVMAYFNI